ncbi:MAG: COX15/CtaA family protein [Anaerolineae bacterium]|nr:COX15/CtaA family protein [Candidatus Roseilinea sp.]MDW8448876.1 COX15/CtaA family protein [Anaerolineae bacterium]
MSNVPNMTRFRQYAWAVLAFNVLVILWGAVVRATGSGAGCGDHWPLCDGHVIPPAPALATFIELFHRLTSGLALILVAVMWIAARRVFAPGHRARRFASISLILIVVESLIGAFIVLQSLTGMDDSALRAVVIAVHQANTLFLLGAITLTAWFAGRAADDADAHAAPPRALRLLLALGVAGLISLGATGAITALGDTLFRPGTFEAGWQAKFSPTAHFLIRLRVVHPAIAMLMGLYVIATAWRAYQYASDDLSRRLAGALTALFFAQCGVGVLNVILLAPVWMQIVHLLLADAVWIIFVLLTASILSPRPDRATTQQAVPIASPALTAK